MNGVPSLFRREAMPRFLLLLTLSTVFLFGNDRQDFYRPGHHSYVSSMHLTLARNLSPSNNFLMFTFQMLESDGTRTYEVYNRFPVGGYVLIKLAILAFDNDLAAQIYAARMLMLLFFCAAAYLAFCSLCRLTADQWIALTATLWVFSSYLCLYYNDMIHPKTGMDLFGVLLVFHGMVLFVQDGRFFQLLVKVCTALLLGWHAFGLLLPFIVLGVLLENKSHLCPFSWPFRQRKGTDRSPLRSRYVKLGIVALLFGILLLGWNFTNEYSALNGRKTLTELPSFHSMRYRIGLDWGFNASHARVLAWFPFLQEQFRRLGLMSLPYVVLGTVEMLDDEGKPLRGRWQFVIAGIAMSVACLIGLALGRHKMLLASLVLSGFCWSLPMRHNTAFHDYEALFYIGIPMVCFSQVLGYVQRRFGSVFIGGIGVVVLLGFVLSSLQMSRVGHDVEAAEFSEKMISELEVIRNLTKGKMVLNFWQRSRRDLREWDRLMEYYLVTSMLYHHEGETTLDLPFDFIVTSRQVEGASLLTPGNRLVFLYDWNDFLDVYFAIHLNAYFDVYLDGNVLRYVKDSCGPKDQEVPFFLHVFPVNGEDLPGQRRQHGFTNLDFSFPKHPQNSLIDGTCEVAVALPAYAIASIRTGQYIPGEGRIWEKRFSVADEAKLPTARNISSVRGAPEGRRILTLLEFTAPA